MYIHLWLELWKHLRLFTSSHLILSNSFTYLIMPRVIFLNIFLFTNIVVKCHLYIFAYFYIIGIFTGWHREVNISYCYGAFMLLHIYVVYML